jgi:aminopeptidase-like protein
MNLSPKGEPQLGRRGLYGSLGGGHAIGETENALLWLLSMSDGTHDLLAVAERSGLDYALVEEAANALERAGLVRTLPDPHRPLPEWQQ